MKSIQFVIILIIAFLMACNSATDYDRSILPVEAQIEVNGVTFTLSLVKDNFTATEQLEGRFTVYNGTSDTIKYNFANMQQLGFKFIDASGIVVLSKPFIVSPALSSLQLAPGNFKEYPLVTTFTNHEGVRMAPGMYILKAYLLDHNSPEVLVKIIIK